MKQKLVSILLVLCMVVALVPAIALTSAAANGVALPDGATAYDGKTEALADASGTEDDPYIIANTAQFMYFYEKMAATATAGQVFKMTGNVYWNAQNKTTYKVSSQNFAGILDGNGKTIYNAYIGGDVYSSKSVFGTVTGTIKNVTFDGVEIGVINSYATGVCLTLDGGLIDNVHVKNAKITGQDVAGIVWTMNDGAIVSNCSFEGEFGHRTVANQTRTGSVGGIASRLSDNTACTIRNCTVRATIAESQQERIVTFGGIVSTSSGNSAAIKSLTVENCESHCDFTATGANAKVGGVIGSVYRTAGVSLKNCTNYGALAGTGATGGMVGSASWPSWGSGGGITLQGCLNRGTIDSTGDNAGGLVGSYDTTKANLQISECANYADVAGANNVGGLVGKNDNGKQSILVTDSAVYGKVAATGNYAGLIVGYHTDTETTAIVTATNCVLTGTVSAAEGAGAIAGSSGSAPTVTNTYFSGVAGLKLVAAGTAATAETATDADFTGTTVLDALNAAASAAGLPADTWVIGQTSQKPELKQFCTDPVEEPSASEITIDGASLTIGENVTLNLFVKTETIRNAGVTVKTISIVNNDGKAIATGELKGTNYVFTISGIKASEFGTNKTYHVQYTTADAPGTPIDCTATKEYSPLQYAINMYGKTDKAGLDALLLSIVNYADAAAGTTTAKAAFAEKHADADWTAVTALAEIVKEDTGKYTYNAETMPRIGASLTETIVLTVYLTDTAYTGVTMKVGDTELTGTADESTQTVKFEGFWATDLYNEITLTFTGAEGTEPLKATTSLVQYLNRYAGNETYAKVATATAQYLYAARNFCLNNQPNA